MIPMSYFNELGEHGPVRGTNTSYGIPWAALGKYYVVTLKEYLELEESMNIVELYAYT